MNKLIKDIRQKNRLTQKKMAELLGMTQHRVSEIERGVDGRSESRQVQHHLCAIDLLGELEAIGQLAEKLKAI